MDGKPYFPLRVEDTSKVAPGHSEVWLRLDCFQVACLNESATRPTVKLDGSDRNEKSFHKSGKGGRGGGKGEKKHELVSWVRILGRLRPRSF